MENCVHVEGTEERNDLCVIQRNKVNCTSDIKAISYYCVDMPNVITLQNFIDHDDSLHSTTDRTLEKKKIASQ